MLIIWLPRSGRVKERGQGPVLLACGRSCCLTGSRGQKLGRWQSYLRKRCFREWSPWETCSAGAAEVGERPRGMAELLVLCIHPVHQHNTSQLVSWSLASHIRCTFLGVGPVQEVHFEGDGPYLLMFNTLRRELEMRFVTISTPKNKPC